jgi:tyrosyl-tRNA synthetase
VPSTKVTREDLQDTFGLLARAQVVASTSEARRAVSQGGIRVNGRALAADETLAAHGFLHERWVLVRKGKTGYHLFDLA